ncbi:MAG: hypothetical protein B7Z38_04580 [Rhodobacterales bacterium 12-64-8]|nr:MAG: hypothetical protein B7Z38_04580 [Rhodobacterales bacterium 12-64-8]OYX47564.1 MAG: hypothetical protein B7Y90_12900 [Alphaproteobacteria bacterium 32-64-14]
MAEPLSKRLAMSISGAIPGIAIAAGLLVLPAESALRQQYWPWLPLLTLALGMGFSLFFWLVIVPWRDRDPRK